MDQIPSRALLGPGPSGPALSIDGSTVHTGEDRNRTKAPRMPEPHPVAFIDLDGLKDINDTLGHAMGDRLLQAVAARFSGTLREADTVARGLSEVSTRRPDLVILDLGLSDGEGIDFLRDLRAWSDVAVIVLSARVGERDKIDALDAGADDYLTKPFGVGELLARVRASARRRSRRSSS